MTKTVDPIAAAATKKLRDFLELAFPEEWMPIAARIIESGAEFSDSVATPFAPRWSRLG